MIWAHESASLFELNPTRAPKPIQSKAQGQKLRIARFRPRSRLAGQISPKPVRNPKISVRNQDDFQKCYKNPYKNQDDSKHVIKTKGKSPTSPKYKEKYHFRPRWRATLHCPCVQLTPPRVEERKLLEPGPWGLIGDPWGANGTPGPWFKHFVYRLAHL